MFRDAVNEEIHCYCDLYDTKFAELRFSIPKMSGSIENTNTGCGIIIAFLQNLIKSMV